MKGGGVGCGGNGVVVVVVGGGSSLNPGGKQDNDS
jgi:hypothetical protein